MKAYPPDPTPGPLDLPTPESVDGVHDLSAVVAAALKAAGCDFADVDADEWYVSHEWRHRRLDTADRLLADWHGTAQGRYGHFDPTEVVTLVDTRTIRAEAHLCRTARGLWLAGLSTRDRVGAGSACLAPRMETAFVDRATALQQCVRWAKTRFAGGPYRRIIASLDAMLDSPATEAA